MYKQGNCVSFAAVPEITGVEKAGCNFGGFQEGTNYKEKQFLKESIDIKFP